MASATSPSPENAASAPAFLSVSTSRRYEQRAATKTSPVECASVAQDVAIHLDGRREKQAHGVGEPGFLERLFATCVAVNGVNAARAQLAHGLDVQLHDDRLDPALGEQSTQCLPDGPVADDHRTMAFSDFGAATDRCR